MRKDLDKITESALLRGFSGAIEDVFSLHKWLDLPFTVAEQARQLKTDGGDSSSLPDLQTWIGNLSTRADYDQVEHEMELISKALVKLVNMQHMSVYGLTIMRRIMFEFAMKDMPIETTQLYMRHSILACDKLYESLRISTKTFFKSNRSALIKVPMGNSYFNYFGSNFGPYHQFVVDNLLKSQPEANRFFLMLRRFSSGHEKLKRMVDWVIALRFAKNPSAKNLITLYRVLDPSFNAQGVANDIAPGLGGHRAYDSKLANALLKAPRSLDYIQHNGMGLKAFVDYQLTGLEPNITTQQKGFFAFASVMLECAAREPEIDRNHMAKMLVPRFYTAFSDDVAYANLCLHALELLPLSRETMMSLTTYALAANPSTPVEHDLLPKTKAERLMCLEELNKLKVGGVKLKASTRVSVLLALKMNAELNKDPLLKRQALEQDLGL